MRNLFLLVICVVTTFNAMSQTRQAISVFKNGTGFFVKKPDLTWKGNVGTIESVPDALFGTIWFSTLDNSIKTTISEFQKIAEKASTLFELLKANMGKRVKINLNSNESFEATIDSTEANYATLKTKDGWRTIADNTIRSIDFTDKPNYEFVRDKTKRVISIERSKSSTADVDMMYMQRNIGWVPCYQIDLKEGNGKGSLVLSANFSNDAEDLLNAHLNLVVGVPNFTYASLLSPLISDQNVQDFIAMLEGKSGGYYKEKVMQSITTQRLSNASTMATDYDGNDEENNGEVTVLSKEDLYFYEIPGIVNLKKGARAIYELIHSDIQYEHIYETMLTSNSNNGYDYNYNTNQVSENKKPSEVWHSIQFKNTTGQPLTTGAAIVIRTEQGTAKPMSQDKLNYTVVGGKAKIKMTLSPDIEVFAKEEEKSRQEKIKEKDGYYYDLLTIEAKINIHNYKGNTVKLNIGRKIWGDMQNCTDPWKVTKLAPDYYYSNYYYGKKNNVEWIVNLKANEEKEITYQYKVYLRR